MAELRINGAKRKLAEGGVVSIVSGYGSPDIIDFIGQFGFDGMWIETEHGPFDFKDIPDLTRACDLWGMTSVVRVNQNVPGVIYRTLDVGAQAIAVPHVNTAGEALGVVEAAKFHPLGLRGNYTGRQGIGVEDYPHKANDETMVMILIEDIIAINNLAEILEVDHIDVFFVATGDLAQTMGHLGEPAHPEVAAVAKKARRQIIDAGRVAGTVVTDASVDSIIDEGVRVVMSSWQPWVMAGAEAYLAKVASSSS